MKYLVWTALVFFGMLTFLPKDGTMRPDNLPLLVFIITCILLYYFIRFIKRVVQLNKLRKLLLKKNAVIKRFSLLPNLFGIPGKYDISAEINRKSLHIVLLIHRNSRTHYHFENAHQLTYFKSNRLVYRAGGASGANISNEVQTKRIGGKTLPWRDFSDPNNVHILVIDRQPSLITDPESREPLGNGDAICKKVYLYNYSSLEVNLDQLLAAQ